MKILAVDTTAVSASVAIAEEDKIIGEFSINTALTHSQTLVPMIEELLKKTNISIADLDTVAVNAGPGSFTGVRIGVSAVKGIAFANSLPCISVSTLESMAYNMRPNNCIVCAVMDARCSQVYNALFKVKGNDVTRLTDDRALALSDLKFELNNYSDEIILVGDGANITYNYLNGEFDNVSLAPMNNRFQSAASTACIAVEMYNAGKTITSAELMPVYLRLPQAQRELNKKMGVK